MPSRALLGSDPVRKISNVPRGLGELGNTRSRPRSASSRNEAFAVGKLRELRTMIGVSPINQTVVAILSPADFLQLHGAALALMGGGPGRPS